MNVNQNLFAFVKCNVDEEFYLTPPICTASTHIWANDYEVSFAIDSPSIVQTEDSSGCLTTQEIGPNIRPILLGAFVKVLLLFILLLTVRLYALQLVFNYF